MTTVLLAGIVPRTSQSPEGQPRTVPSASPSPSSSATQPAGTPAPAPNQEKPPAEATVPPAHGFFVMIDPAHGGDDRGSVLSRNLAEKEVTLALARRVRSELQERGIYARLLRDGDITLSMDQRAENANEQHAAVYLALHAGMPGQGVRVYTPALASVISPAGGKFPLWENAQANSLPRSQELAQRITVELGKKNLATAQLATPIRPLNNVIAPAVAIELASAPDKISDIVAQKFQTTVAAAIASGIAQLRPRWENEQ